MGADMSSTAKHWMDIAVAVAAFLGNVATPLLAFVTSVLGTIWYGIRIYEWWKGRKNGNVGHN